MRKFITLAALAMFSLTMIGCHADIGPNDDTAPGTDTHYKKTTTYDNNGTHTTKTETTVNP